MDKGCRAERYVGAGEQFDSLALSIIKSIKNASPLQAECFTKLQSGGTQLTPIYLQNQVVSNVPKTDLISLGASVKISVKKKGAQFISAQGNEAAAVFLSVLKNDSEAKNKLGDIIKDYFKYEKGLSHLKNLAPDEKKKVKIKRQFLLKRILNFGGLDLKEKIMREAILGEYKFTDVNSIPNYFLVWSEDGSGALYTADQFIRNNISKVKFGVRGRGGTRGLSLRGEI